jgi:hypothetical protein
MVGAVSERKKKLAKFVDWPGGDKLIKYLIDHHKLAQTSIKECGIKVTNVLVVTCHANRDPSV